MPRSSHTRPLRRACALIAIAASAAFASAAPADAAVDKAIWGPDRFPAGSADCPGTTTCSAFPVYAALGVDTYQFQILWDRIAPTRPANPRNPSDPAYKWPSYVDYAVQQGAASGVGLAALARGTPAWANGGNVSTVAPSNPDDYADFVYAASLRYPSIRRWMIWGEPNYAYLWQPMPANSPVGPRLYAELLDKAYVALKEASPANIVIGGMTVNSNGPVFATDFIKWAQVKNTRKKGPKWRAPRVDWWGHNPFEARYPNLSNTPLQKFRGLNDVDTLHKELKDAYRGKKKKCKKLEEGGKKRRKCEKYNRKRKKIAVPKIWLSEWTVLSDHGGSRFFGGFHVSRLEQSAWISEAFAMLNRLDYVQGLGWFKIDDQEVKGGTEATWGLMTYRGERKPAYLAYQAVP